MITVSGATDKAKRYSFRVGRFQPGDGQPVVAVPGTGRVVPLHLLTPEAARGQLGVYLVDMSFLFDAEVVRVFAPTEDLTR